MDKMVADMSDFCDSDDKSHDKSLSPTQPVLLSQNAHLLLNKDDPVL